VQWLSEATVQVEAASRPGWIAALALLEYLWLWDLAQHQVGDPEPLFQHGLSGCSNLGAQLADLKDADPHEAEVVVELERVGVAYRDPGFGLHAQRRGPSRRVGVGPELGDVTTRPRGRPEPDGPWNKTRRRCQMQRRWPPPRSAWPLNHDDHLVSLPEDDGDPAISPARLVARPPGVNQRTGPPVGPRDPSCAAVDRASGEPALGRGSRRRPEHTTT
jgi:hypothetical protein